MLNYINKYIIAEHDKDILNNDTIATIRDKLCFPIKTCEAYHVNIENLFPIIVSCGGDITIKFYQSGEVYMHEPNNKIICLYRGYGSDSLCQDR